jgi:hypothetical protein
LSGRNHLEVMAQTNKKVKELAKPLGPIGCAIIALWLLAVIISAIRGCRSPYHRARANLSNNPCLSAQLFAQDVRGGSKGAINSLNELLKMTEPCALKEMVGLLDMPDTQYIDATFRNTIYIAIRSRVAAGMKQTPPYYPSAPQNVREKQKAAWEAWLDENYGRIESP